MTTALIYSGLPASGKSTHARELVGISSPLFMRATGDHRPDSVVKLELFNKFVRDNYHVRFVLDDRNSVIGMWRSLGLDAFQVNEGNF